MTEKRVQLVLTEYEAKALRYWSNRTGCGPGSRYYAALRRGQRKLDALTQEPTR